MRYNTNYAKLIDGVPSYAPHPVALEEDILIGGITHPAGALLCTDRPDALRALGYKQVIREEMPVLEGYYYTETWTESEQAVTQGWEAHEIPVDETPTEQDYIDALNELGVDTMGGEGDADPSAA